MKRFFVLCLAVIMMMAMTVFAEIDCKQLTADMTEEELVALHAYLSHRIACMNKGDVVYNEDGITISWIGISQNKRNFTFQISNNTGKNLWMDVDDGAINGILIDTHWNTGLKEIPDGMSLNTITYKTSWMWDDDALEILDITHASTIMLHIKLYSENKYNALAHDIKVSFPVDLDIE